MEFTDYELSVLQFNAVKLLIALAFFSIFVAVAAVIWNSIWMSYAKKLEVYKREHINESPVVHVWVTDTHKVGSDHEVFVSENKPKPNYIQRQYPPRPNA